MENQELINKVIVVSAKEEKMQGGKPVMKIKDQDNLTYTVYKTKQDGTESAAWKQMPSLEDTVQIGFVEQKGEYEGKPVTYRTIRVFNKDIGTGIANHQAQTVPSSFGDKLNTNPLYNKPKEEPKNDKFWDMKAYKQCLWNYWLEKVVVNPQVEWKDDVWRVFQEIEDDAKKRFFDFSEPSNLEIYGEAAQYSETKPTMQGVIGGAELPTIQVQEDTTEWDKTFNCEVCNAPGRTHGDGHECIGF